MAEYNFDSYVDKSNESPSNVFLLRKLIKSSACPLENYRQLTFKSYSWANSPVLLNEMQIKIERGASLSFYVRRLYVEV